MVACHHAALWRPDRVPFRRATPDAFARRALSLNWQVSSVRCRTVAELLDRTEIR
jgi:hypothetical protein